MPNTYNSSSKREGRNYREIMRALDDTLDFYEDDICPLCGLKHSALEECELTPLRLYEESNHV